MVTGRSECAQPRLWATAASLFLMTGKAMQAGDHEILLVNLDSRIYAINNTRTMDRPSA